jgi:hypothetical protein
MFVLLLSVKTALSESVRRPGRRNRIETGKKPDRNREETG